VQLTDNAVEFLINKGFDKKMGARPLQRTIDEHIKKPLSKEILFGHLVNGGIVEVDIVDEQLKLNYIDVLPIIKVEVDEEAKN
jgi:ATP-dependent Clp protease ATP-binding subunit ClpA